MAFVALAAASPIVWYVAWPHAEVFEWSLVVASLCAYDDDRPVLAAALAAVGATQAPPIAVLSLGYVALTLARREWRDAIAAAVATSLAALPAIFFLSEFGRANLIVATGMADPRFASLDRTLALWFGLDEGMLVFVPVVLVAAVVGVATAKHARRTEALVLVTCAVAMTVLATESCNFNAGCVGMNRYAVWIAPVLAFVGTRNLRWRRGAIAVGLGAAAQVAIVLSLDGHDDATEHHALAELALRHAPSLYRPDVETFTERTTGRPVDWPFEPVKLPVAYGGASIDQLLVDRDTLDHLDRYFEVRADWLAEARSRHATSQGLFYVEPGGAVRRRQGERPRGPKILDVGPGWSYLEGEPNRHHRWMGARGELVVHRDVAGPAIRFIGMVPSELASPPTMEISVRGLTVDHFVAPRRAFTRDVPLPQDGPDEVDVAITTSATFRAEGDGRDLGYALTTFGPLIGVSSVGGQGMSFRGGWHEPFGVPPSDTRCMGGPGVVEIAAASRARSLWVYALAREDGPASWTVTIDGRVRERGPIFRVARRAWTLAPNAAHTVSFEASPASDGVEPGATLCFAALRVVDDSVL